MAQKIAFGPLPPGFRFYKAQIIVAAERYSLDPSLVAAVCWKESDFQTHAHRFEPAFWNRYLKGKPEYRHLNPIRVSSSYGLMQVMYCRVLEDRIKENDAWEPELLFLPENGLDIGCAFLRELLTWAEGKTDDPAVVVLAALASYNGGRGGNDPSKDSPLRTGAYARDVLARRAVIAKEFV